MTLERFKKEVTEEKIDGLKINKKDSSYVIYVASASNKLITNTDPQKYLDDNREKWKKEIENNQTFFQKVKAKFGSTRLRF